MKIQVQFFSRLRDVVGASHLAIDLADEAKVSALLCALYSQHPALAEWDSSILVGAGLEFVARDYAIKSGDEIAIMPPVQGG